jgi:hypothetical protein
MPHKQQRGRVEEMRKLKKPLLIAAGAIVLVAAAVLGVLSVVKTSPWEMTISHRPLGRHIGALMERRLYVPAYGG